MQEKNHYREFYKVKCPFYKNDAPKLRAIRCEGLTEQSVIRITFQTFESYRDQLTVFCCSDWKNCEYNLNRDE